MRLTELIEVELHYVAEQIPHLGFVLQFLWIYDVLLLEVLKEVPQIFDDLSCCLLLVGQWFLLFDVA